MIFINFNILGCVFAIVNILFYASKYSEKDALDAKGWVRTPV